VKAVYLESPFSHKLGREGSRGGANYNVDLRVRGKGGVLPKPEAI
jgi:hypothetical protein